MLLECVIPEPTKCVRTASSSDIRSPVCFLILGILSKEARHYRNIKMSYFDIDDIMAEEQGVPCQIKTNILKLGHFDSDSAK